MTDRISNGLAWLLVAVLAFAVADTWRQSRETNRFIERILEAIEARHD